MICMHGLGLKRPGKRQPGRLELYYFYYYLYFHTVSCTYRGGGGEGERIQGGGLRKVTVLEFLWPMANRLPLNVKIGCLYLKFVSLELFSSLWRVCYPYQIHFWLFEF